MSFHGYDTVSSNRCGNTGKKNPKRVFELSRDYWAAYVSPTAEFMRSLRNVTGTMALIRKFSLRISSL